MNPCASRFCACMRLAGLQWNMAILVSGREIGFVRSDLTEQASDSQGTANMLIEDTWG